ncbi:Cupin domain protein [Caprobacter fermentans]|uniref:Cupin domain protein n=1 Tax=Caproicibacter fermentans TaxID=2576756 RepID=A0A6N8HXP8_9FIRM|nr:cupin domain-containing protein [Caproicibacter fermentans]MVB10375.1 Cupin domain protein [Caproicibacter fermentans]QNK40403.1 cupin domain-containing protein [Caproicibacter fermentans]
MNSHYLKNIDFEKELDLTKLVEYQDGQVVSRTLAQNQAVSITLFAFDQNEEISSHSSGGDAMVMILEGTALITIGEKKIHLDSGKTIIMPAGIPHAVASESRFKMLLVVVFPR